MYPLSDGTARYYANQIPQPSQQNIIPVTAIGSSCTAASQNLAAIMIGDVLNNWTPNDAPLFRPSAPPTVVLDIQNAALSNGWWTIPVSTGSSSLHAVDIKGLTVQDSVKLELGSHFETVDNTINGAYYATSFYKDYEATNIPCTAFCIKVKGVLPSLSGFQNTIYIDGELATVSTGSCFTPTQEIQEGGVLIVSPNPTNGGVTVTSETNITRIIIYNAIGQVVLENIVNDKIVKVDMGKQDTGIYMLQVFNENGQKATEKIVIQR
jgi:hypothetical protein